MTHSLFLKSSLFVIMVSSMSANASKNRYSQSILVFGKKPFYVDSFDPKNKTLTLKIKGADDKTLKPLDFYDEKLIRKLIIKEDASGYTKIKFVFKDRGIKYHITTQVDPHRLSIEFFDKNYAESRDPLTGLPIIDSPVSENTEVYTDTKNNSKYQKNVLLIPNKDKVEKNTDIGHSSSKRKLLQPIPTLSDDPQKRIDEINQLEAGLSKGWNDFPLFIYRINTAPYKNTENYKRYLNSIGSKKNQVDALAEYASKLYDFGHEIRAMAAYRYVLQNNPLIFNNDPIHLWKLAEVQFGHKNFTLASGYYSSLIDSFPESDFTNFAKLRLLDIKYINAMNENNLVQVNQLKDKFVDLIDGSISSELLLQIGIRISYLSDINIKNIKNDPKNYIASSEPEFLSVLINNEQRAESQKTLFLTKAIILKSLMERPKADYGDISKRSEKFLKTYTDKSNQIIVSKIKADSTDLMNSTIRDLFSQKRYLDVIDLVNSESSFLKKLPKNSQSNWAIAESYKSLGQYDKALPYYEKHSKDSDKVKSFISGYWALYSLVKTLDLSLVDSNINPKTNHKKLKKNDKVMWQKYNALGANDKKSSVAVILDTLNDISRDTELVASPSKILLEVWEQSLMPLDKPIKAQDDLPKLSPTSSTVSILINLKKTFEKQGLNKEKERTVKLLSRIDPKIFENDISTKKIWATELLSLAKEYKKQNRYLDAGRMYTLTGSKSDGWEKRAEALYKGGLLLYRAGKRSEAVDAFQKASTDSNNILYAELAKKRLEQLLSN